jgi:hypothetical protein
VDKDDLNVRDGRRTLGADGEENEAECDVLCFVLVVAARSLDEGAVAAADARESVTVSRGKGVGHAYFRMLRTRAASMPISSAQATAVVLASKSGRLLDCRIEAHQRWSWRREASSPLT